MVKVLRNYLLIVPERDGQLPWNFHIWVIVPFFQKYFIGRYEPIQFAGYLSD
jgi:hypothetical protein